MAIESQYRSIDLMAIVMFALYFTIYEIFAVEIRMTLTMTFRIGQGQMLTCNLKANVRLSS